MSGKGPRPTCALGRADARHAEKAWYCSCGVVVNGNGARAPHAAAHARRCEPHRYMPPVLWRARFPERNEPTKEQV